MHLTTTAMAMAMTVPGALSALQSCSSNVPLSCHNKTTVPDASLCCFNAPGGLLVQTQFWDTDPATGPDDSWTIHGLWYLSSLPSPVSCTLYGLTVKAG